jgi:hypothetical protein
MLYSSFVMNVEHPEKISWSRHCPHGGISAAACPVTKRFVLTTYKRKYYC